MYSVKLEKRCTMPLGNFVEAGTTPKPLPIGRVARFLFGLGTGFYFVWNFIQFSDRVNFGLPETVSFVGVFFAWWYFSDLMVVGFSRPWGRWPQIAIIAAIVALVIIDLVLYGSAWGLPLAWGLFLLTQFVYGAFAISFVLAALFAVPG